MLTPTKTSPMKNSSSSPLPGSTEGANLTPSKYNTLTQPLRRLSTKFGEMLSGKKSSSTSKDGDQAEDELLNDALNIINDSNSNLPEPLKKNISILSPEEIVLASLLVELKQEHLFESWESAGINDVHKHEFFKQVLTLNGTYPGGLKTYITRSIDLLEQSKTGKNPLDGWIPFVPKGIVLNDPLSPEYEDYEIKGKSILNGKIGFIIVAGGLGERLGYSGIKTALPSETTTNICYMELYCQQILAFQKRYTTEPNKQLPFAIMVSDDTYTKTIDLLNSHNYFGLNKDQVKILKQEKVAALQSADGKIASLSPYVIDAKPHGHGDIHSLMHSSGTASKWLANGIEYIAFFQDTNGLCFNSLSALLGVTLSLDLYVNSLTIPRKAKQAVGGITRLVQQKNVNLNVASSSVVLESTPAAAVAEAVTPVATHSAATDTSVTTTTAATGTSGTSDEVSEMTINVEYNQLDPLLRSSENYPSGDINDAITGFSPFPGNINQLVFKLAPYLQTLRRTNGVMSEFVNPKYTDETKTKFKKPTRLECMMQDYPKSLTNSDATKVGFTMLPPWFCYSPCKNNIVDAAISISNDIPAGCAYTAESDQYNVNVQLLKCLGAHINSDAVRSYASIPAIPGPRIVFHSSFAVFPSEIKTRFPTPHEVFISPNSTLIIKGDVVIYSLHLNGALRLQAVPGTRLFVYSENTVISNKGHHLIALSDLPPNDTATTVTETDKMRGYKLKVEEELEINTLVLAGSIRGNTQPIEFVYNSKNIILKSAYEPDLSVTDSAVVPANDCHCFGLF